MNNIKRIIRFVFPIVLLLTLTSVDLCPLQHKALTEDIAKSAALKSYLDEFGESGVKAWNAIFKRNLPERTNTFVLEYLDEFSTFRNSPLDEIFDDAHLANPNLLESFRTNGKMHKGNLLGYSYEGRMRRVLNSSGEVSLGGKSFDGAYGNKLYEAKYRDFWPNTAMNNVSSWKTKFDDLHSIATSNGKVFEVVTEGQLPQVFKEHFDSVGIIYKEGFL